ncbi:MAG: AAA family ATPase, partial [Planctomycetota bacterium]|nr:AAA family ATPase [Planctomycetota bacterium]
MSDENPRNQNNSEPRGGGNVWLVLIAIVSAVLLSAFLMGNTERRLRYPDLMALLRQMAEARTQSDSSLVAEANRLVEP